jgi:DNA-binding NarL/FixJ family response regulator
MRTTQVLIVSADTLTRMGIATIVDRMEAHHVCGEAESPRVARELCTKLLPDLIVIDLPLLGSDGFGLVRELARVRRDSRTLVIGLSQNLDEVQRAFRAGARAFVDRRDAPAVLQAAFSKVSSGGRFASEQAEDLLLWHFARTPARPQAVAVKRRGETNALSEREQAVFELIGQGLKPTAIARSLGISVKTVETHQQRIRAKLEVETTAALRERAARFSHNGRF